ncbi:MFS transporter [Paenibacillus sp. SC116]|uniref:MFS transporter n=1 Tax=Paenibacillus sp. SC116 TaxID=2968986 RepID=UPI00215B238B|nr:MFS transporter [Paenibacillus sp. SC116]MCR8844000.1 MFS transporter [Paenibacillus sp. SC116]
MALLIRIYAIIFGMETMLYMTRPVISLLGTQLGASTFDIGMLTASYAFLPVIFAIYLGKMTDRIGDKIPNIAGVIGMMVGLSLPYVWPSLTALYISQMIIGIARIMVTISLQNMVGRIASPAQRDQYYGWFSMSVALGGVFGPVLGGYIAHNTSYVHTFFISVLVGIIPFLLCWFIPTQMGERSLPSLNHAKTNRPDTSTGGSFSLLRSSTLRKALLSSALVLYSRDIFVAYFPLLGAEWGMSDIGIGWIIAIQSMAMVAVRLFLSPLTKRYSREVVLIGSILTAGIAFMLVPLTSPFILMAIISAAMGLGLGCGQPLSMTTIFNASPPDRTGEVLGLRLMSNRLSQMIAPLFFGFIGASAGIASVFYLSGIFLIGGALVTRTPSPKIERADQGRGI